MPIIIHRGDGTLDGLDHCTVSDVKQLMPKRNQCVYETVTETLPRPAERRASRSESGSLAPADKQTQGGHDVQ